MGNELHAFAGATGDLLWCRWLEAAVVSPSLTLNLLSDLSLCRHKNVTSTALLEFKN